MDDNTLIIVAIYVIIINLWSEYYQPDHPDVSSAENQSSIFCLDAWPLEKQRRWMRFTTAEIRQLLFYFEIENVAWSFGHKPDPEMVFCFLLCKLS